MSLRKQAVILGVTPSYLSMLINGKRKWPDALRHKYEELMNTAVNTQAESVNNAGWGRSIIAERRVAVVPREGFEPTPPKRGADFKSAASALSPPGPVVSVEAEGQTQEKRPSLPLIRIWRRRADSNRRIELLQSSALTTWLRRLRLGIITLLVPRRRFELLRVCTHGPLKTACLPIPPPRHGTLFWQEWEDSNPRPAVLETAALPAELHSYPFDA